jgi:hypothetical protein
MREGGAVLARALGGDRALPVVDGYVLLSKERLCRHVLVCGATGSGKTETVLRLAWAVASCSEAAVFYLDGKGDRAVAERFAGLMGEAGRSVRVFPHEPLDGWRGAPHELMGRLMEVVDYAKQGPAAWYRDLAKVVVGLVCEHPQGPPRSSGELLARMDLRALKGAHGPTAELMALSAQQVGQVQLRYAAFFGATRGALDGRWAWEEADAAYLMLDSLSLREETACLARFLLEDFTHYFTSRKPRERWALLVVDEYSVLADVTSMARCVEQARGFNTTLVLVPQVIAGMGTRSDTARILGSVETVVCHRVNTPEEIVALAGTREVPRYSTRFTSRGATGEGLVHKREQNRVDPNQVRSLPTGEAFLISCGRAMRARILRAPSLRADLPSSQPPPPPPPPTTSQPPLPPPRSAIAEAQPSSRLQADGVERQAESVSKPDGRGRGKSVPW